MDTATHKGFSYLIRRCYIALYLYSERLIRVKKSCDRNYLLESFERSNITMLKVLNLLRTQRSKINLLTISTHHHLIFC